jgi:hypothetical protein
VVTVKIGGARDGDQTAHSHHHSWKRPRPGQPNNRQPRSAAIIQERELISTSKGSDNALIPMKKLPYVDTLPMKGAQSQQRAEANFSWKRPRDENSNILYSTASVPTIPTVSTTTVENIMGPARASKASHQAQKYNAVSKGASGNHSWKRPREENSIVSSKYPSEKTAVSSTTTVSDRRMAPASTPHASLPAAFAQPAHAALTTGDTSTLRKVGHGKLVRKGTKSGIDTGAEHSVSRNAHSVAKRIQLDRHDNTQNAIETSALAPNDSVDSTVRLTDHAYRSRQKSAARSLVRVPVDETTTRICRTVFQGRTCNDATCRKRHDVAQEFTIPICTFFQRPGLGCRAGDACPFRHVKVTSRAAACPNFARLGFCQDTTCKLAHMSK